MKRPTICSTIKDESHNITFHIMAYRTLTKAEKVAEIRAFMAQPRRPVLVDGQTVVIETLYRA